MVWSLYEKEMFLEPLIFSNGKTQENLVEEVIRKTQKGNNLIFIKGMCGTGKCLDKNTLVFCKPSEEKYFIYYKISELVGKKGKILSLNTKGKIVESFFKNVRKTGRKKLYKLKTRTGREIIASQNHSFLTITEKGIKWAPLKNLDTSSYVCLPNKIDIIKKLDYEDDKIKILAHLIAEGKLGDKFGSPVYFQCPKQNLEIREDYIDSLRNLFPDGEIKSYCKKDVVIIFNKMDTSKGTTNKLRIFIREHGLDGKRSNEKFIPKIIFNLENDKIALFLNRLFSCDGSIYIRNKKSQKEQIIIEYCSISKRLIQDISLLLGRFSIHHTITSKRFRDNSQYSWRISISNHKNIRKFIKEIGFIGKKQLLALNLYKKTKNHKFTNIDKIPRVIREYVKSLGYNYTELDGFLNYDEIEKLQRTQTFKKIRANKSIYTPFVFNQLKIDFLRKHIKKINEYIKDDILSFICSEEILWDKIKYIEPLKEDETYDLEVPKNNNFIANGIIVHNSAIALNIAKELGKTSIIVPGKGLQTQYKKDYEENKYVLKKDKEKLKISVITGRNNHKCKFIEDDYNIIPKIKKEVNSKLHDIFEGQETKKELKKDFSADNAQIPCKIEIKEKNLYKIKQYLKQNKDINHTKLNEIKDIKRVSVAGACPYWSPVLPEKYELGGKSFVSSKKRTYEGLENIKFIFYQRRYGCKFYEQFNQYIDSDVIVFNSLKYLLESALNRKPLTEVEIFDECDEFLDSLSNQRTINLDRFQNSLIQLITFDVKLEKVIKEIHEIIKQIKSNKRINNAIISKEIIPLKETGVYDLLKILLNSSKLVSEADDESYIFQVEETAKIFEDFFEESYLTFSRKENNLIIGIVTTNLAKKFKEIKDKNKIIILMSGTIHSTQVLKDIFGLDDFTIIEAETKQQGKINLKYTGLEIDCKYSNFYSGKHTREEYLKSLGKCIEIAKKPVLVHVNAFADLPSKEEIEKLKINNLISREEMRENQNQDKTGNLIRRFKNKEIPVLFSTKCGRGIDFPGEECNSIVFTKYPNPNVKDAFWRILMRTRPQHYWEFYKDKAKRELLQKVYRGLRFKQDKIDLLSPDKRVLEAFE